MTLNRLRAALVLLPLALGITACTADADKPPQAPTMPTSWTVKADQTFGHKEREFLDTEGRLAGRMKALRVTLYDVSGQQVTLYTIVPYSTEDGDKIFRVLANRKPAWAFLRKNDLLYEFAGPETAEKDITAARETMLP